MTIQLKIKELRELNEILGMLKSPDKEAGILAFDLLQQNSIFKEARSMFFCNNNNKDIPVQWYIDKAYKLREAQKEEPWADWYRIIIPIVQAITLGEPKFKDHVIFEFDYSQISKEN